MRLPKTVLVAICLTLPLAACGQSVSNADGPTSSSSSSAEQPANSEASEAEESPSEAEEPSSLTKKFGSTFTWDDGVALTVSKPKEFTSGPYAAPASTKGYLFDVTVKNGSKEPVEAFAIMLQATSDDQQAEQIFDVEAGIDAPSATLLPGRTIKYKVAFTKPGDSFTMQVDYGFGNAQGFYE